MLGVHAAVVFRLSCGEALPAGTADELARLLTAMKRWTVHEKTCRLLEGPKVCQLLATCAALHLLLPPSVVHAWSKELVRDRAKKMPVKQPELVAACVWALAWLLAFEEGYAPAAPAPQGQPIEPWQDGFEAGTPNSAQSYVCIPSQQFRHGHSAVRALESRPFSSTERQFNTTASGKASVGAAGAKASSLGPQKWLHPVVMDAQAPASLGLQIGNVRERQRATQPILSIAEAFARLEVWQQLALAVSYCLEAAEHAAATKNVSFTIAELAAMYGAFLACDGCNAPLLEQLLEAARVRVQLCRQHWECMPTNGGAAAARTDDGWQALCADAAAGAESSAGAFSGVHMPTDWQSVSELMLLLSNNDAYDGRLFEDAATAFAAAMRQNPGPNDFDRTAAGNQTMVGASRAEVTASAPSPPAFGNLSDVSVQRALLAMAVSNHSCQSFMDAAVPFLMHKHTLQRLSLQQAAELAWACARLDSFSAALFNHVASQLTQTRSDRKGDRTKARTRSSANHRSYSSAARLSGPHHLPMHVHGAADDDSSAVAVAGGMAFRSLGPDSLARVLWAFGHFGYRHERLFQMAEAAILDQVAAQPSSGFSAAQLAQIVVAFSKVGHTDERIYLALLEPLEGGWHHLTALQAGEVLLAYETAGVRCSRLLDAAGMVLQPSMYSQ